MRHVKRFEEILRCSIPASSSNCKATTPTVRRDLPSSSLRNPSGDEAPVSSQTFNMRCAVALSRPPFFMLCTRKIALVGCKLVETMVGFLCTRHLVSEQKGQRYQQVKQPACVMQSIHGDTRAHDSSAGSRSSAMHTGQVWVDALQHSKFSTGPPR